MNATTPGESSRAKISTQLSFKEIATVCLGAVLALGVLPLAVLILEFPAEGWLYAQMYGHCFFFNLFVLPTAAIAVYVSVSLLWRRNDAGSRPYIIVVTIVLVLLAALTVSDQLGSDNLAPFEVRRSAKSDPYSQQHLSTLPLVVAFPDDPRMPEWQSESNQQTWANLEKQNATADNADRRVIYAKGMNELLKNDRGRLLNGSVTRAIFGCMVFPLQGMIMLMGFFVVFRWTYMVLTGMTDVDEDINVALNSNVVILVTASVWQVQRLVFLEFKKEVFPSIDFVALEWIVVGILVCSYILAVVALWVRIPNRYTTTIATVLGGVMAVGTLLAGVNVIPKPTIGHMTVTSVALVAAIVAVIAMQIVFNFGAGCTVKKLEE